MVRKVHDCIHPRSNITYIQIQKYKPRKRHRPKWIPEGTGGSLSQMQIRRKGFTFHLIPCGITCVQWRRRKSLINGNEHFWNKLSLAMKNGFCVTKKKSVQLFSVHTKIRFSHEEGCGHLRLLQDWSSRVP